MARSRRDDRRDGYSQEAAPVVGTAGVRRSPSPSFQPVAYWARALVDQRMRDRAAPVSAVVLESAARRPLEVKRVSLKPAMPAKAMPVWYPERMQPKAGRMSGPVGMSSVPDDPKKPEAIRVERREAGVEAARDVRKEQCLSENRPRDTKGDGSSRPFVPWCQKGK